VNTSRQRVRRVSRRLWALLAIAFVGYEVVLYRYWRESVGLLPARIIALEEDQAPIGFTGPGLFAVAHHPSHEAGLDRNRLCGPVTFYGLPGDRVPQRLSSTDAIGPGAFLGRRSTSSNSDWRPLNYFRDFEGQPTLESAFRKPHYRVLDENRALSIDNDGLLCVHLEKNRVEWFRPGIESVLYLEGDLAVAISRDESGSSVAYDSRSLIDLKDGRLIDTIGPGAFQDIQDISSDRKWLLSQEHSGTSLWSLTERRRLWTRPHHDTNCRVFRFSEDGRQVESAVIGEANTLHPVRIRTSDGTVLSTPATGSSVTSATALPGRRFAMFQMNQRPHSGLPLWLEAYAMRWGLFGSGERIQSTIRMFDLDSGEFTGTLDTTHARMFASPDREVFALARIGSGVRQVEIYSLPPRRNWLWWFFAGIVLPCPLVAIAVGLHRRELRLGANGHS